MLATSPGLNLPESVLKAAKRVAGDIPTPQLEQFVKVVSDSRQLACDKSRWNPFTARVLSAGLDGSDSQHLWALEIAGLVEITRRRHRWRIR
jgi:hypothetical protein